MYDSIIHFKNYLNFHGHHSLAVNELYTYTSVYVLRRNDMHVCNTYDREKKKGGPHKTTQEMEKC